jgi:hypothetical protein
MPLAWVENDRDAQPASLRRLVLPEKLIASEGQGRPSGGKDTLGIVLIWHVTFLLTIHLREGGFYGV